VERLFVYGTLKRGCAHHDLLAGARFAGAARTAPGFVLVDLGAYPGMVRGGAAAVAGELFAVERATLARLDRFEGHPHLFRRARVPLADGRPASAYLLDPAHAAGIPPIPPDAAGTVRWQPPDHR
jgi:gamma-glutamylaminecyclotransferase